MRVYDFLTYLFSAVGGAFLFGAFLWYQSTVTFLDEALEVPGVVSDLVYSRSGDSNSYYPVVRFEDSLGRMVEFRSSSGSNPPSYDRGDEVSVFYRPEEPENARIDGLFSLWGGALVLGILGVAFAMVGILMMLVPRIRKARGARLRKTGHLVTASLQTVELNTSLVVNGQCPFRIVTQWQDPATAKLHVFRSENLWFDPTDYLPGESIGVYISPGNPQRYWVDTSFLPQMAT